MPIIGPNEIVVVTELLPVAVVSHPFDHTQSLKKRINDMEDTEWDKLAVAFMKLYKPEEVEKTLKKLEGQSNSEGQETSK